jgi:hypothetical protein
MPLQMTLLQLAGIVGELVETNETTEARTEKMAHG